MAFKIVFFGSPEFAAISLERLLHAGVTVRGVVTAPDRPKGRSMRVQSTPVRHLAEKAAIPVLTPLDVNATEVVAVLRSWMPDVICVVAFGQILKEAILSLPPLGCINVHPSLLPRYRGAAPIQRTIMEGQTGTGVTVCRMVRRLDCGDILSSSSETIRPDDTFGSLHDRLACLGADLLVEVLKALALGSACSGAQDEKEATYAPKIKREEEFIRWDRSSFEILNLIRALNPVPGACATLRRADKGEMVKIWSASEGKPEEAAGVPGKIVAVDSQGICVATGKGLLWIKEIQSASKEKMEVGRWLLGHPVKVGDCFERP